MAATAREVIDLTGDDDSAPPPPPRKEKRPKTTSSSPPLAWRVFRTLGIPADGNSSPYCAGFREAVAADRPAEYVVLANFKIDATWLVDIWPELVSVPRVVVFCHQDLERQTWPANFETHERVPEKTLRSSSVKFGSLHAKFAVVGFNDSVRVMVTSANFINKDVHHLTNAVWWQDFPRGRNDSSEFGETLRDFVASLVAGQGSATGGEWGRTGLSGSLSDVLRNYDFADATASLIPTVPGVHKGAAMSKYGQLRVRRLTARCDGLVAQFSSMANTTKKYVDTIKESFGRVQNLQIVWPTAEEIRASTRGYASGGSLPSRIEHVDKLREYETQVEVLHRWSLPVTSEEISPFVAARRTAIPHLKSFTGFAADDQVAWSIVGSHNISKACWGELQRDDTQLACRSWELGVLVTPQLLGVDELVTAAQYERFSPQRKATANVGIVPLPFPATPPVRYSSTDSPWALEQWSYPVPDAFDATGFASAMHRGSAVTDYGNKAPEEEK